MVAQDLVDAMVPGAALGIAVATVFMLVAEGFAPDMFDSFAVVAAVAASAGISLLVVVEYRKALEIIALSAAALIGTATGLLVGAALSRWLAPLALVGFLAGIAVWRVAACQFGRRDNEATDQPVAPYVTGDPVYVWAAPRKLPWALRRRPHEDWQATRVARCVHVSGEHSTATWRVDFAHPKIDSHRCGHDGIGFGVRPERLGLNPPEPYRKGDQVIARRPLDGSAIKAEVLSCRPGMAANTWLVRVDPDRWGFPLECLDNGKGELIGPVSTAAHRPALPVGDGGPAIPLSQNPSPSASSIRPRASALAAVWRRAGPRP